MRTVEAEQDGLNSARASTLCNTAAVSAARCGIGVQEGTRHVFSKRIEEDARARSLSPSLREWQEAMRHVLLKRMEKDAPATLPMDTSAVFRTRQSASCSIYIHK